MVTSTLHTKSHSANSDAEHCHRSAESDPDRAQQKRLLAALNAWDGALRRDECGEWRLDGKWGSIHSWGDGTTWVIYATCRSERHWTATKGRLSFCDVTQDGSTEGCLRLHQLPTHEQATVIRDVLGVRKRMEFTPDDLERRRASMTRLAPTPGLTNATLPGPGPIREQASILRPKLGI